MIFLGQLVDRGLNRGWEWMAEEEVRRTRINKRSGERNFFGF
jgi:hypothetical protein